MIEPERFEQIEDILKVLASETRLRVLYLLSRSKRGMRFNEIAHSLGVHTSTLEDHLRKVVDSGFVSHQDNRYTRNMNTERALKIARRSELITPEDYFRTHLLELPTNKLIADFVDLQPDVLSNILLVVEKVKENLVEDSKYIRAGGALDISLESTLFALWRPDLTRLDTEFIFTEALLSSTKELPSSDILMDTFSKERTQLYCVQECYVGYGFSDRGGMLFLPDLALEMDYSQCLFIQGASAVSWFNDLHETLKETGVQLDLADFVTD